VRSQKLLRIVTSVLVGSSVLLGIGAVEAGAASSSSPILVGGVALLTTPSGFQPFAGLTDGAKAEFAAVNRAGGIDGRQIKMVDVIDDQGSPTATTAALNKLVLQDNVSAVVPVASPGFTATSASFLASHHVIAVGDGFSLGFCFNHNTFSYAGCVNSTKYLSSGTGGNVSKLIPSGTAKTVAIEIDDVADGATVASQQKLSWEKAGYKVCLSAANISDTATDYSPNAKAILTACNGQPPAVASIQSSTAGIPLTGDLKSLGFKGVIQNFTVYVPSLLQNAQSAQILDGTYNTIDATGTPETNPAQAKTFLKDLKAVGATYQGVGTVAGYVSALLLVQVLKAAGSNLSYQHVTTMAAKGFSVPGMPGIMPTMTFPIAQSGPVPCNSTVEAKGSKFVGAAPLQCYALVKISG
jgi:ABC-type branched-subunit amino acid transport system substrate-binding protein